MKRSLLLPGILSASAFNDLLAAPPSYIQTKDGVIVFTDPAFSGTSDAGKLTQTFQSTSGDAWYGLGQHQDGILNPGTPDKEIMYDAKHIEVKL